MHKKDNSVVKHFIAIAVAILVSGLLLEMAGVDATKANIFSWQDFSLAVFILFGVCIYALEDLLISLFTKLSGKTDQSDSTER